MTNPSIQSLHGQYFSAEICFVQCYGRISVNEEGMVYLCQDETAGGGTSCRDFFGYKYAFYYPFDSLVVTSGIQNLKILPPPTEYHTLFQEILEKRGPTWDVDGSYSVIPDEVLAKIKDFMDGIKVFEPKNPGK